MEIRDQALVALGQELRSSGYQFTVTTPTTHRLVLERATTHVTPEAVWGWNAPFRANCIGKNLLALIQQAGELDQREGWLKSNVRFATLGELVFVHSGFPTNARDSVFFGPDTYRFARALRLAVSNMIPAQPFTVIDIGCGSGAGGLLTAAQLLPLRSDIVLSDINEQALRFSRINAEINGFPHAQTVYSDVFEHIAMMADLIVSNPPYLVDDRERLYCHGGCNLGLDLSLRIAEQSLGHLKPGGRLVLYTGSPVVAGSDLFLETLRPILEGTWPYSYEEIDPDVFGDELAKPVYGHVDRIAAVVLTVTNEGV